MGQRALAGWTHCARCTEEHAHDRDCLRKARLGANSLARSKGGRPAGAGSTDYALVINLKVAKALGLTVPVAHLARAAGDQVNRAMVNMHEVSSKVAGIR